MPRTKTLLMPLAAVIALAVAVPVLASEKRPLPDVSVTGIDRRPVSLSDVAPPGAWLLVYLSPGAVSSARLIAALKEWEAEVPQLTDRLVLIVGGARDEAERLVTAREGAPSGRRWFHDPDGSAADALRVARTPTIIGVDGARIEWALAGVLNDPTALQKTMTGWVERP